MHVIPWAGIWINIEVPVRDERELEKVAKKEDIESPIFKGQVIGYDL